MFIKLYALLLIEKIEGGVSLFTVAIRRLAIVGLAKSGTSPVEVLGPRAVCKKSKQLPVGTQRVVQQKARQLRMRSDPAKQCLNKPALY